MMKFDSQFSIYRYWQHVKHRPGLYFFFSRFDYELLYIGKANDIHTRFTQYTGNNNHLKDVFHNVGMCGVVYIDDKNKIEEAETKAIKYFKPPFNLIENYGHTERYNDKYKTGLQIEIEQKKQDEIDESLKGFKL